MMTENYCVTINNDFGVAVGEYNPKSKLHVLTINVYPWLNLDIDATEDAPIFGIASDRIRYKTQLVVTNNIEEDEIDDIVRKTLNSFRIIDVPFTDFLILKCDMDTKLIMFEDEVVALICDKLDIFGISLIGDNGERTKFEIFKDTITAEMDSNYELSVTTEQCAIIYAKLNADGGTMDYSDDYHSGFYVNTAFRIEHVDDNGNIIE